MELADYFSGIGACFAQRLASATNKSVTGYLLTHLGPTETPLNFTQLLKLLSTYAEWCRTSSYILQVNPPTVVQMLFVLSPTFHRVGHPSIHASPLGRFALTSSVAAGKGDGREDVRAHRVNILETLLSRRLPSPTPVQRQHANSDLIKVVHPSAELFGTPWGHCGESISFAACASFSLSSSSVLISSHSMHKSLHTGIPLGTLALSVKAMNTVVPGTSVIPVDAIPNLHHIEDIVEVLRISGAMRPMCLNCLHMRDMTGASIDDYAVRLAAPSNSLPVPSAPNVHQDHLCPTTSRL